MSFINRKISLFKGVSPKNQRITTVEDALEKIKIGISAPLQDKLRAATDEALQSSIKKEFPAVTWSALMSGGRKLENLQEYTGIICLDIDGQSTKEPEGLTQDMFRRLRDEFTLDTLFFAVFTSPRGNGIKLLVRTMATPDTHLRYFLELETYIREKYAVKIDPSGKDVNRLCFLPTDPGIYVNRESTLFEISPAAMEIQQGGAVVHISPPEANFGGLTKKGTPLAPAEKQASREVPARGRPENPLHQMERAEFLVSQIRTQRIDLTGTYEDWQNLCFALSTFGERGRDWFHDISQFHPEYDRAQCDKKFDEALKNSRFSNAAFFFKKCKDAGLNTRLPKILPEAAAEPRQRKKKETSQFKFWYIDKVTDKEGNVKEDTKIDGLALVEFLNENGFWRYAQNGDNKIWQFIHIHDNVVDLCIPGTMKDFTYAWLDAEGHKEVKKRLHSGAKVHFSTDRLDALPYKTDLNFLRDDKNTAYLFYANSAVKISVQEMEEKHDEQMVRVRKASVAAVPYAELSGCIWKKQILKREYKECAEEVMKGEFAQFLWAAITNEQEHEISGRKFISAMSGLGYLLHGYKDPSVAKVVTPVDARISRSKDANGRTGKSLYVKATGYLVPTVKIDARNFKWQSDHAFAEVNLDTRIINFNDCPPKFEFDRMFGMVTDGFTFKTLYAPPITVDYDESPKFAISTNYVLKGEGASYADRQFIVEFSQHFNDAYKPSDKFGHNLFKDWDAEEWLLFDHFMIECLKVFMEEGLMDFPVENYELRKIMDLIHEDFMDWFDNSVRSVPDGLDDVMEGMKTDTEYDKKVLFDSFKKQNPDFDNNAFRINTFTMWLWRYAQHKGWVINPHKMPQEGQKFGRDKRGNNEYIIFKKAEN